MRIKQTIKRIIASALLIAGGVSVIAPVAVAAAECGGVETSIVSCGQQGGKDADIKDTGVWGVLLLGINILTAGVGVVAVAGIVYASILYTTSRGEADKVKKAMTIISDIVIGIVAYALMYAALNFLVPGGLFT